MTADPNRPHAAPLDAVGHTGVPAWLVGGAVRDQLLGVPTTDYDVVVEGDPAAVARAVGRGAGGHPFELSESFGAWRVVARDRSWQLDVMAVQDGAIELDLARRDLTINALAEPLRGGGLVDPFGGADDLQARRLRAVSDRSFQADPLRVLRLARLTCELGFEIDPATAAVARAAAPSLASVAPERCLQELARLLCSERAAAGIELLRSLGIAAAILPELDALDGIEQSRFHHLDVLAHTQLVMAETVRLTDDPSPLGLADGDAAALRRALAQPLANDLTRGQALRFGALLHDIAKPQTRAVTTEGRVTFMGHDRAGAEQGAGILRRLRASEKLAAHVAALTLHHLRLGFLVHQEPLPRRAVYDYLLACAPVAVDVTLLSVADRLATRGDDSERAIMRHVELAQRMLPEALAWEAEPPSPPIRGDELARALAIKPGPELGGLLAELQAQAFSGEVRSREQAIDRARELLGGANG